MQTGLSLHEHAQRLLHDDATADHYSQAVHALVAALDRGTGAVDLAILARRLILQPPAGMHQLAFQACHFATSSVHGTVRHLTQVTRVPLLKLIDELDCLPPDAQRRVVLFAVTTRAFSQAWLPAQTVSALHKAHFANFTVDDLALPYSVIFHPDIYGENQQDLLEHFMPQGVLETTKGLAPSHVLMLAWLSGANIFADEVQLSALIEAADLTDTFQAAAARSLLMRFGHRARASDRVLMDHLGMSSLVNARVYRPAGGGQEARFRKKRHQALAIGLNRVKVTLPFLASRHRKPKVGICISGQLRGYEIALATWKSRLFSLIEPHIFVHSWAEVGRSGAQPSRDVLPFEGAAFSKAYKRVGTAMGFEEIQKRYPTLFEQLSAGGRVTEAELAATYDTAHVMLEDDKATRFASFTNPEKMHYKIHAADRMARSDGDFDLLMRLRPDLSIRDIGFGWPDLLRVAQSRPVLFAEKGFGVHYGGMMIGDQCAIATPDVMQTYADTWTLFPKLTAVGFAKMPAQFSGHTSLAQTCWLGGLDVQRAPIRFGTLNEARKLSVADCLAAIEADSTGSSEDQELLGALQADR